MRVFGADGRVRFEMGAVEVTTLDDLLVELLDDLRTEFRRDDPVHARLYPAAYADSEAEGEFRELTETGLRTERVERAERCRADLVGAQARTTAIARRSRFDVVLDPDACDRWMRVLNDLRLVIGTRLGVSEEEDLLDGLDPSDPQALSYVVYGWLTHLQDNLVRLRMG